ncbi:hypothetical protein [Desulfogranum japonicum]|uniref:hypothetical protein n=1 Tax=Desulfogranum japonicum TaxID=231447 RepID=UPI0004062DCF|nr:hypothetical protein [Desulfogranum japonicum]
MLHDALLERLDIEFYTNLKELFIVAVGVEQVPKDSLVAIENHATAKHWFDSLDIEAKQRVIAYLTCKSSCSTRFCTL